MVQSSLFDSLSRLSDRSPTFAEPYFPYLNISGRPTAERIRQQLDDWYGAVPEEMKLDLRNRFRSSDDMEHLSAFTELYVHALLVNQGYEVEVHPPNSKGTRIDFMARIHDTPAFVLEVRTSGDGDRPSRTERQIRALYDSLNRLENADIYLIAQVIRSGFQQPSARRARHFLRPRLETADWETLRDTVESGDHDDLPRWTWIDGDWVFDFIPIPRPPELRRLEDMRLISGQVSEVRTVTPGTAWGSPLRKKASHYGRPELPYVIAINGTGRFHSMRNIPDALFGSHSVIIDRTTMKATPARADNGLWIGLHGPKYKRVSAVLFFRQLTPWSLASCDIELWHNPWADKPFEIVWLPVAQRVPNRLTGEMQKIVVKSTAELFDLEAEWPGED